jgi:F like protein
MTAADLLAAALEWGALLALADRLTPALRRALLVAFARLGVQLDAAIVDAIVAGDVARADRLFSTAGLAHDLTAAGELLRDAMTDAGDLTATQLGDRLGLELSFNLTNPRAVAAADQAAALLVTRVTQQARDTIRQYVRDAVAGGATSAETARLIRPIIGLTLRGEQAVVRYREQLVAQGVAPARIVTRTAQYADALLRQRATTIARTEIMTAANRGKQELWQQAIDRGLLDPHVRQRWVVTPDDRLCARCRPMHGQLRALGDLFECPLDGTTALAPPLHPNCRCALVLVRAVPGEFADQPAA